MLRMIRLVFVACLATGAAVAEPRNIGECEQIQAADAYNRCLASFGPAARAHNTRSALSFAPEEQAVSHSGKRSGAVAERGRRGRLRMMFTPGGR
ncbi:hypothetical protein IY145_14830 [Methylosinus sp. H3A]|uniref:hypothetical protein n=1 Tax=Methylosinus sp. H3A TaxID=2785786 RepID=UPI0018C1D467|nr:hypothetical protein [Methylosinus sp. H3A]MBG0810644.1 hypothetical protein [Methylosinus sp. H3A]